eukprot:4429025-Amphidinium_carterae.1
MGYPPQTTATKRSVECISPLLHRISHSQNVLCTSPVLRVWPCLIDGFGDWKDVAGWFVLFLANLEC